MLAHSFADAAHSSAPHYILHFVLVGSDHYFAAVLTSAYFLDVSLGFDEVGVAYWIFLQSKPNYLRYLLLEVVLHLVANVFVVDRLLGAFLVHSMIDSESVW